MEEESLQDNQYVHDGFVVPDNEADQSENSFDDNSFEE